MVRGSDLPQQWRELISAGRHDEPDDDGHGRLCECVAHASRMSINCPTSADADAAQGMMGGGLGTGAYGVSPGMLSPWFAQLMPRTPWYS